jgi:hypothetical protein
VIPHIHKALIMKPVPKLHWAWFWYYEINEV